MKAADKYKYWAMLSDYDLETARILLDNKRWVYVAYMCHQALERQLKGMYVYYLDKEAPKSHNLAFIFDRVRHAAGFPSIGTLPEGTAEQLEDFLTETTFYYVSDYPFSYKRITSRFIDADTGMKLYREVLKCITLLRSLQPMPEPVDLEAELKGE